MSNINRVQAETVGPTTLFASVRSGVSQPWQAALTLLTLGLMAGSPCVAQVGFTGCDTGDSSTTCVVNTTYLFVDGETITGTGSLLIAASGSIENPNPLAAVTVDFPSVTLETGSSGIVGGQIIVRATDLTVEPGASLSADGLGFEPASGPGAGGVGNGAGGGGHGGKGGIGNPGGCTGGPPGTAGSVYGSSLAPETFGSGGGNRETGALGGSGGGAVRLEVSGSLVVDGEISADGGAGVGPATGGGAGGSIYVTAGSLSGAGRFHSDGGAGTSGSGRCGGGGGGGRIAAYFTSSSFDPATSSVAGAGFDPEDRHAGSLIFVDEDDNAAFITSGFRFQGVTGPASESVTTPFFNPASPTDWTFGSLTIQNAQVVQAHSLNLPLPLAHTLSNVEWTCAGEELFLFLSAGDFFLDATSTISLDGCGFEPASGPGAGGVGNGAGGGGHGGKGGIGNPGGCTGGPPGTAGSVYGSSLAPETFGSGGGNRETGALGGSGGGAVRLEVSGSLVVDGEISADGGAGVGPATGGGAGGSIYVTAGSLSGAGRFHSDGGAGTSGSGRCGGGGGGGRIAAYFTSSSFDPATSSVAGAGFDPEDRHAGSLIFVDEDDNAAFITSGFRFQGVTGPASESVTTPFFNPASPTDWTFGSLTIQNAQVVQAHSLNLPLPLAHTLSNVEWTCAGEELFLFLSAGDFFLDATSTISLDGCGFEPASGPGAGGLGFGAGGGGHGGEGGVGNPGGCGGGPPGPGGASYGSEFTPTSFGSGGGTTTLGTEGGAGGGTVRLNIAGVLSLDGEISSRGEPSPGGAGGGGAGGSVFLSSSLIAGSGSVIVDGGDGSFGSGRCGGGGAGGRIAAYSRTSGFDPASYVAAGAGNGADGTVHIAVELPSLQPDLAVFSSGIRLEPSRPDPDEEVTIVARITNLGATPSEQNLVRFLSFDSVLSEELLPELQIGESVEVGIVETFATVGFRLLTVQVDPADEIAESDEQNNEASKVLQVGRPREPDAVIVVQAGPVSAPVSCGARVLGRADYDFDVVPGTEDFPVQGGRVTVDVLDQGSGLRLGTYGGQSTDVSGGFIQPLLTPATSGTYDLRVTVSDETLSGEFTTELQVAGPCQVPRGGGSTPEGLPDAFVLAEGIHFTDPNPPIGASIDVLADIHYSGSDPVFGIVASVNDVFPVRGQLETFPVVQSPIDFPDGVESSPFTLSTVWTNSAEGAHIIQVTLTPGSTFIQPTGNDEATRLIFVGDPPATSVAKSATLLSDVDGDGFISPGDLLFYTIEFENGGTDLLTSAVVVDDYDEAILADPVAVTAGGTITGGTIVWDLADVGPGETGVLTYEAEVRPVTEVPVGANVISNIAFFDSDQTPAVADSEELVFTVNLGKELADLATAIEDLDLSLFVGPSVQAATAQRRRLADWADRAADDWLDGHPERSILSLTRLLASIDGSGRDVMVPSAETTALAAKVEILIELLEAEV